MLSLHLPEKKGIHIIDLNETVDGLQEASAAMKQIAKSGKNHVRCHQKQQAKEIVNECVPSAHAIYNTERWLGGMLYQFQYCSARA